MPRFVAEGLMENIDLLDMKRGGEIVDRKLLGHIYTVTIVG
jgi:hypothetical protein